MRSWENRPDTHVIDEPFYASYLFRTGLQHPGREQVLASQSHDWRRVVEQLDRLRQQDCPVFYQKHMTHHIDASMSLRWIRQLRNCFLIRNPLSMLLSLRRVLPEAQLDDTGLPQQLRLFETVLADCDDAPLVIDSDDLLRDPRAMLTLLCARLGVSFDEAMLSWPAGPRDSDGVWAPFWYDTVLRSTGFAAARPIPAQVPAELRSLLQQCQPIYDRLAGFKLVTETPV